MRIVAALVALSPLWAQGLSLGLRAGIPITPMLTANGNERASEPRFTIGPLIEGHLWHGAAFGADFLLQRTDLAVLLAGSQHVRVWRWETPLTLTYRFRPPRRPFLRIGVSLNRVFDISGATECARGPFGEQFYCIGGSPIAELRHRGTFGFVGGGGLRFPLKKVHLEPEVRLTHWIDRNIGVRGSAVRSNLNQVEFLMGAVF
jgi:hypothetical protein